MWEEMDLPVCVDETNAAVTEVARARDIIWTDRTATTATHDSTSSSSGLIHRLGEIWSVEERRECK